ncbi:hypothetical protein BDK51DRAFT_38427 [Blyttiomyces helicus]|uniref:Uncharacterized protein n=1 Tax=Blyttiomyces helicus TaxID=388810 RepID=A0A4P9WID0_9FUNG|nr:hypothetical protein BDK51DRAFT_38427 [Blyttiomyces helicus]|eukprot:RKO91198.1 hypothetical protein BDK51DRAFT_38427 [Blyttiomyces helicus]
MRLRPGAEHQAPDDYALDDTAHVPTGAREHLSRFPHPTPLSRVPSRVSRTPPQSCAVVDALREGPNLRKLKVLGACNLQAVGPVRRFSLSPGRTLRWLTLRMLNNKLDGGFQQMGESDRGDRRSHAGGAAGIGCQQHPRHGSVEAATCGPNAGTRSGRAGWVSHSQEVSGVGDGSLS